MSEPPPKRPAAAPAPHPRDDDGPPRLERVPPGYGPPAPSAARARGAPVASYGMAEREVGADAAIAAGLAHRGSLARESALRVFGVAAGARASGRLVLEAGGRRCALWFRRGAVEHAESSEPAEGLGAFLLRRGAVTPEQLVEAEAAKTTRGGDLLVALLDLGHLSPAAVAGLLAEHGAAVVMRALALEDGSWAWEPDVPPPPGAFPLGAPLAPPCAAVRALEVPAVRRRLGDRARRAASRIVGRLRLEELRLTPQEARAAALLDSGRSPDELAAEQPAEAGTLLRVALLLGELDLVAFGAFRPSAAPPGAPDPSRAPAPPPGPPAPAPGASAGAPPAGADRTPPPAPRADPSAPRATSPAPAPPPPAPPRPAGAIPAAPPARPASAAPAASPPRPPSGGAGPAARAAPPSGSAAEAAARDPAALAALAERLRRADHFEALGVKRDAPPAAIKAAYFQRARLYHPDAVPAGAPEGARRTCAEIFARVSEAWGVLSDDGRRARYLEQLRTGGGADVDVMRILQAENAFQAATQLVRARQYEEARARLAQAIELNPEEAEFAIWQAWCDFLLASDQPRQHPASAAAIEAALRRNSRCAPGYLFLGQMAKLVGDPAAAERHLRRGLAVAPEHADLVRELKYLRR